MLESFFDKTAGLKDSNTCVLVKFANFSRTPFFFRTRPVSVSVNCSLWTYAGVSNKLL